MDENNNPSEFDINNKDQYQYPDPVSPPATTPNPIPIPNSNMDLDENFQPTFQNTEVELKKEIKSYKKLLLIASVIVVLCLAGFLAYYFTNKTVATYNAEVSLVSGQVEKSETKGSWIELQTNDNVKQGDTVRVNGAGKAIITLDDGSAIRLTDESRIVLISLDPKNIQITNENGEVYTRVVKADRSFVVKVDSESYSSIGTAYKTINNGLGKGVFVYESTVKAIEQNMEIGEGKKFFQENNSDNTLVDKVLDITEQELLNDEFALWNKDQDLKSDEFKDKMGILKVAEQTQTTVTSEQSDNSQTNSNAESSGPQSTPQETPHETTPTISKSITLSGSATDSNIHLNWTLSGFDAANGFKVIKGTSANPVYPGDSAVYVSSVTSNYNWDISDGVTYHFRVCHYVDSGCGIYSNDVQVTAPKSDDAGGVASITATQGSDRGKIDWVVDGYSSKGFKIVWSRSSGPTYPTRSTDKYYYSNSPDLRTYTVDNFDGAGTYHVRVCEYLGGSCGVYSNEVDYLLTMPL